MKDTPATEFTLSQVYLLENLMKKSLIVLSLICLFLVSCGPFSYWRNFYDP